MKAKNGILKGELKVKEGKLIRCQLILKDSRIDKIKFSGDFFMYPEEKIEELEKKLRGIELKGGKLKDEIYAFFEGLVLIGAHAEDFVTVIRKAN